jgi:ribosome-binding protein aMBF1 (putative translation factor)
MKPTANIYSIRPCTVCGKDYKFTVNQKYCDVCRKAAKAAKQALYARTQQDKRARDKAEQAIKPEPRMTDAQQKAWNLAVDNKNNIDQGVKHYRPGTPEFYQVAQDIIKRRGCNA